jgi:hypothetical protein
VTRDAGKLTQKRAAEPLALKLIDDAERHFSLPGLNDDVAPGADDHVFSIFVYHRNQGGMVHEANVYKVARLLAKHGDAKPPDLAAEIADCPRNDGAAGMWRKMGTFKR